MAVRATARMAAFMPGASPPLVRTAIRFTVPSGPLRLRVPAVATAASTAPPRSGTVRLPTVRRNAMGESMPGDAQVAEIVEFADAHDVEEWLAGMSAETIARFGVHVERIGSAAA